MEDLTIPIRGMNFHYRIWGGTNRDAIVCLHGTSGHACQWEPLAAYFKNRYRVYALDQRGHGDSDKPPGGYDVEDYEADVDAFCDGLSLRNYVLIGNSLGSRVSFFHAAMHPQKVKAIVLVDLSFAMPEEEQQKSIQGHLSRPRRFADEAEALAFSKSSPLRARWGEEDHQRGVRHDFFKAPDGSLEWKYSLEAVVTTLRHARRDLIGYAPKVRCPTLLLRGAESNVLNEEKAREICDAIPDCRLVVVPDAGHSITRDNPRVFLKLVEDFLEERKD